MLQQKLNELTVKLGEMKQLKDQLQNVQESKQHLERENEDFNNRSNTLHERLESDVIKLKQQLEESLTQNSDLRGNNERLEQLEHYLENQISELQEKLRLEKVQHEEELEVLRSKLKEAEVEKNRLEEQITGLQVELDTLRKRVKELESSKESTQEKLSKITCDKGVKLVEYQQEVKRLDGALTDQRREWDVALNHEKGEVKRLKDIVSQKNDEIKESGERIKKLKEIVDEKEKFLFKERVLVKKLESELKKIPGLTNKIEELQKEKVRLEEEKKKSVEVLEETTKELDEQNRLVEELESELKQIEDLTKEVQELQKEKVRLEEEKKKSVEVLEETTKELDEQNRLVEELESELKQIEDLTKEVQELQKEKVRLEEEKGQLVKVLEETKKELDEQKELVEQLQSEQKSAQEQIKGLKRQVAELIGKLETGEAEVKKLQEEKEELQAKYDNMVATNMNSIKLLNAQNEKLRDGESEEINKLNQELQRVESELAVANGTISRLKKKKQAPQREEPEPEPQKAKTPKLDTVSMKSGVSSSSSKSMVSRFFSKKEGFANWPAVLLKAWSSLDKFLFNKDEELKKTFPTLRLQPFCHGIYEETMKSLSNENDGRFESKRLLELLKDESIAKKAIENRIIEVVVNKNKYYDEGKTISAVLTRVKKEDSIIESMVEKDLKSELLLSVEKCMKKLEFNKKDAPAPAVTDSIIAKFKSKRKESESESRVLLKEIVVEKLVDIRMKLFTSIISEGERCKLASSIRDKVLSEDKICNKISEKENTYQLNSKIVEKYKNTPNSDLGEPSTTKAHVASLPKQPDKKSSTTKPPANQSDEPLATSVPTSAPKQRSGFLSGLFNR